jgi:hypothetical protein
MPPVTVWDASGRLVASSLAATLSGWLWTPSPATPAGTYLIRAGVSSTIVTLVR